jgi:hypothetical protein
MNNNRYLIDDSVVSKAGTAKLEALATSKFASAAYDIIASSSSASSSSASSSSASRIAPALSQESQMSVAFYQRKKTKLENELRLLNEQFARTDIGAGEKFVISVEIEYNVTEIDKLYNLIDKLNNGSQQKVHASHNKKTGMGGSKRKNKTKRRAANKDK